MKTYTVCFNGEPQQISIEAANEDEALKIAKTNLRAVLGHISLQPFEASAKKAAWDDNAQAINLAKAQAYIGSHTSPKKAASSAANGKKGGIKKKCYVVEVLKGEQLLATHNIYFARKGSEIPGFAVVANKTGYYSVQVGHNGYQFWPANKSFATIAEELSCGLETRTQTVDR